MRQRKKQAIHAALWTINAKLAVSVYIRFANQYKEHNQPMVYVKPMNNAQELIIANRVYYHLAVLYELKEDIAALMLIAKQD